MRICLRYKQNKTHNPILVCLSTSAPWFGCNKSSIHRVRCENVPAEHAIFVRCWCQSQLCSVPVWSPTVIQGVASPVKWAAVRGLPPSYSFGATFDFRPLLTKAFFVWFQSSKMSLTHCSFTVMLDLPCTEWCRGQSWRLISHSSTEDRKFLCDHLKSRLTMCAKMILWDHS